MLPDLLLKLRPNGVPPGPRCVAASLAIRSTGKHWQASACHRAPASSILGLHKLTADFSRN
jgi:hypothetical protein